MKASLNHLPERKRAELARIVSIIRQSAPQADTPLLVYTNYKPKTHDLDTLRRLAANHDPAFFSAFPLRTKQQRDRFDLLRQAYVGARYHDDYRITPKELKYLARCVELLRDETETSCQEKMKTFA